MPFRLGATPGSRSQTDHGRSALIWAAPSSLTQLLTQLFLWVWPLEALRTSQIARPMPGPVSSLLALWLRSPGAGGTSLEVQWLRL